MTDKTISESTLKISAVGDISLGDHPVCVGHGMRSIFSRHLDDVISEVSSHLRKSEITIGNLETVTSDKGLKKYWLPSYEMRGNPAHLSLLKKAGINLLGVANNHSMQHGIDAFNDMLIKLEGSGIPSIGVDDSHGITKTYKHKHIDGSESFIFAVSTRPEEWADGPVPYSLRSDPKLLLEEVKKLRASCSGFLICSIHWGLEFIDYPSLDQVQLAHSLVDNGVDVVFGHHSHVLQPVERYKNGLIFYSLGNFVFDLWSRKTKYSIIANVELSKSDEPRFDYIPVIVNESGCVRPASGNESKTIDRLLSWQRYLDNDYMHLSKEEYTQQYRNEENKFRYSSYRYFIRNSYKYPLIFLFQSVFRTLIRRLSGN